jgi:hypothetical protein
VSKNRGGLYAYTPKGIFEPEKPCAEYDKGIARACSVAVQDKLLLGTAAIHRRIPQVVGDCEEPDAEFEASRIKGC